MLTINSQTKEISRSGQYWALAHFSRAVRRGARRFESKSEVRGLEQVGFVNPDAQKVLILTNTGPEQRVSLRMGDAAAEVILAPDSLTTLVWS
jgi:glucosylceramidase